MWKPRAGQLTSSVRSSHRWCVVRAADVRCFPGEGRARRETRPDLSRTGGVLRLPGEWLTSPRSPSTSCADGSNRSGGCTTSSPQTARMPGGSRRRPRSGSGCGGSWRERCAQAPHCGSSVASTRTGAPRSTMTTSALTCPRIRACHAAQIRCADARVEPAARTQPTDASDRVVRSRRPRGPAPRRLSRVRSPTTPKSTSVSLCGRSLGSRGCPTPWCAALLCVPPACAAAQVPRPAPTLRCAEARGARMHQLGNLRGAPERRRLRLHPGLQPGRRRRSGPQCLNFGGPGPLPCSSRREAAVPRKPAAASAWPQKVSKALLLPFLLFRHARARPLGMHRAQRRVKSGGLLRLPARAKAAPRRALGGLCEGLRCPAAATTPVRHSVPCAPPPSLQVVQHRRGGARHAGAGAQGGALRGQPGRHLLRARRERRVHAVGRGDAPRLRGRLLRGLGAPLPRPTCLLPPARLTGHTAGSLIPAAPCLPPTRSAVMVRCLWPRPCLLGGPCAVSPRAPSTPRSTRRRRRLAAALLRHRARPGGGGQGRLRPALRRAAHLAVGQGRLDHLQSGGQGGAKASTDGPVERCGRASLPL